MEGMSTEASLKLTGRSRLGRILRNKFVAGLIILIPIVLTVKGVSWLFSYVDGLAQPLAVRVLGRTIWGVGIVITVGVVFLTGFLFSKGPLKKVLDGLEDLLDDVPLVGTVYGTTKKVLSGFGSQQAEQAFQSFVFAQLPGRTTPGFLMKTFELTRRDGQTYRLCSVYVPTNHLYVGDVVILPEDDVIETDLTVEDGVSMILSAGASVPERIGER
jgi:uncharacterized membrane protein